jgi:hypothetical protein
MLVREKQDFLALRKRPFENFGGVRRSADNAPVLAAKRFQIGRRINVGDWRNFLVGIEHRGELTPASLYLGQVGHVGHRAARSQIREDRYLLRTRKNIRNFGHEMHAAKNDVFGIEG